MVYADRTVLRGIDLDIPSGKTTVLIGPSGCGKSTLLRLIIGLISPDAGTVIFDEKPVEPASVLAMRRKMGYVIQDGGLFPHLTAERNVTLMARYLGWERQRIRKRVDELRELTHLPADTLDRYPAQLSGGQRQRVGLMRALMLDPELLLLDEPLGALDPMIRADLQFDLSEIFRSLQKTVVLVTHDIGEAAFFGDSIVLLRNGQIVQHGTVYQLMHEPAAEFVTSFFRANGNRWMPHKGTFRDPANAVVSACRSARLLLSFVFQPVAARGDNRVTVRVGSKVFTESVILGEIVSQLAERAGAQVEHRAGLGGTQVVWKALLSGDVDIYPEYTGTIDEEILSGMNIKDDDARRAALAERGVRISRSLGFSDSYAIGIKRSLAEAKNIKTISDLRQHPELRLGFSSEFLARGDGWPKLKAFYKLPQADVRGMEHELAYRGLESGAIDATELFTTDAQIKQYDLVVLEDDLHFFPPYEAVLVYRSDLESRAPQVLSALLKLEDSITVEMMTDMNARSKLQQVPEAQIAADFLHDAFRRRIERANRDVAATAAARRRANICTWYLFPWSLR